MKILPELDKNSNETINLINMFKIYSADGNNERITKGNFWILFAVNNSQNEQCGQYKLKFSFPNDLVAYHGYRIHSGRSFYQKSIDGNFLQTKTLFPFLKETYITFHVRNKELYLIVKCAWFIKYLKHFKLCHKVS